MNIYQLTKPLINLYQRLLIRPSFYNFYLLLYHLALRGMGVLNFENEKASGEAFLLKTLAKHFRFKVCLDVGAHRGKYTLALVENFPQAKIFAFEPHPGNFSSLKEKISTTSARVYQLALGNKRQKTILWDHQQYQAGSQHASFYKTVIEDLHQGKAKSFPIKIEKLDNFASRQGLKKIDFLKIDTEGAELSVLQGASRLIKNQAIDFIQFEFNSMNVKSRVFLADFFKLLPNYRFYRLFPQGILPLATNDPLQVEIFAFQNIVAVSPSRYKKFAKLYQ